MKLAFIPFILVFAATAFAFDHPAEEAEAKLAVATKSLQTTIQRVERAIKRIHDKDKQETTVKTFLETQRKWREFADAEIATYLAATPVPDSSTAAMLTAYVMETSITETRTKQLGKLAEWLEANYK